LNKLRDTDNTDIQGKGVARPKVRSPPANLVVPGLAALSLFVLCLILASGSTQATITGDVPPASGDWIINNPTKVTDETVLVRGDVIVGSTLTLEGSQLQMSLSSQAEHILNVTPSGKLVASDSVIESADDNRFRFEVRGELALDGVTVEDCYRGIRVMTAKSVSVQRTSIVDFFQNALYLEDTDGAVVSDVIIHHNALGGHISRAVTIPSAGYAANLKLEIEAVLVVNGGSPRIDDVDVSVNGTVFIDVDVDLQGRNTYIVLDTRWPMVTIDTREPMVVSDVKVRDTSLVCNVTWNMYTTLVGGRADLAAYLTPVGIKVQDHRNLTIRGFSVKDFSRESVEKSVNVYGPELNLFDIQWNNGLLLVDSVVNETLTTDGPHDYVLVLEDVECSRMTLMRAIFAPDYSGTGSPTFRTDVILTNVTARRWMDLVRFDIRPAFDGLKYIDSRVEFVDSTFEYNREHIFEMAVMAGPSASSASRNLVLNDTLLVDNCTFFRNIQGDGLFRVTQEDSEERANVYDRWAIFRDNLFERNVGTLIHIEGHRLMVNGTERVLIDNNEFLNNGGSREVLFMNLHERDVVTITNNTFEGNVCGMGLRISDFGGDSTGAAPARFKVSDNTFTDNQGLGAEYAFQGFLEVAWGGYLEVSRNNISESRFMFLNASERPRYSQFSVLAFHDNTIHSNAGTIIMFNETGMNHTQLTANITDNRAWDNDGPIVDYNWAAADVLYNDTYATILFANNTVLRSSSEVFIAYGKVTITGNLFKDCGDYVIVLDHINGYEPTISGNTIIGCKDGIHMSGLESALVDVPLLLSDMTIDASGIALWFERLEVTMVDVHISEVSTYPVIVDHARVDAYDSTIPMGLSEVRFEGHIKVWFSVDVLVEWANASGVPSGNPAVNATVTFINSTGVWAASNDTGQEGRAGNFTLLQWSMGPSMIAQHHSPYDVLAEFGSVTSNMTFWMNESRIGGNALVVLLVDPYAPDVVLSHPEDGDLFNTTWLLITGLVVDVGSQPFRVEVGLNDGEFMSASWEEDGKISLNISSVPEGDVKVVLRAYDAGLNWDADTIWIVMDRTPPMLEVDEPGNLTYTQASTVTIRGRYEVGARVTINLGELTDTSGLLDWTYDLWEGPNAIVVTAWDEAGNSASITVTVIRDSTAPTLSLLAPRDGLFTNASSVNVLGKGEEFDFLEVTVHRLLTDIVDEPIEANPDGSFTHVVDLEEGENTIVVTARDLAGNIAQETLVVTRDSTPPDAEITSPYEGSITSVSEQRVQGTMEPEAMIYLNGKRISNNGTLDRIVILDEGENLIELLAIDELGNARRVTVNVTLDTLVPTIVITSPVTDPFLTNLSQVVVSGTLDEEVAGLSINGLDTPIVDLAFTGIIELPQDGLHLVTVEAWDEAGNVAQVSFTVDLSRTPPFFSLVFDPPQDLITDGPGTLRVFGTATGAAMKAVIVHSTRDGEERHTLSLEGNPAFTITVNLTKGRNTFTVTLTDVYGNSNTSTPYTVVYQPKGDDEGLRSVSPGSWGLLLASIVMAVAVVAYIWNRKRPRDR
jgi:hypothetical protein